MNQTLEQREGVLRRLNEAGCPVLADHSYKLAPVGLAVAEFPGGSINRIYDFRHEGTGYAIELSLRNEARHPIDVVGWQIRTPWGIPMLSLLRGPNYSFPVAHGPYYEADFIINRHFMRRKARLQPGEEIDGLLVASSPDEIPLKVPHHARVIANLLVFDSHRNSYSLQVGALIDRHQLSARDSRNQRIASPEPAAGVSLKTGG